VSIGVVGAQTPTIFQQGSAPNAVGAFSGTSQLYPVPFIDDLWVDTVNHQLKRCTSVAPYIWIDIEGGGSGPNFADEEVPTGAINGSNVTFTLAFTPSPAASLILVLNGVIQHQGAGKDYTISGNTITFAVAPTTGDILLAWYRH
jgi:hypothetical protein